MDAAERQTGKEIEKMKLKLMAMAAIVAFTAAAMPSETELEKANKDVQTVLKTHIAAWQKGDIGNDDLAVLMLLNADKFKDEARRYACLQAAFAAAARADDAALAAKALERICADIKHFWVPMEEKVIDKALAKVEKGRADKFRAKLDLERAKIVIMSKSVKDSDARVIAKMRRIMIPSTSIKPPATLADAVEFLRRASVDHDAPGARSKGVNFLLSLDRHASGAPAMPRLAANNIRLFDMLKLVVDVVGYDFKVASGIVVIFKKEDAPTSPSIGKMKQIMLPSISFKPPATLADAVDLLGRMSVEHDPAAKGKGVSFWLNVPKGEKSPAMPVSNARNLKLYDAIDLCCKVTGYDFQEKGEVVEIFRKK